MTSIIGKLFEHLKRLSNDECGGVAIIAAVTLPTLIGFAALGVDISFRYARIGRLQVVADAAAINGANAVAFNETSRATTCRNEIEATTSTFSVYSGKDGYTVSHTGCDAGNYIDVWIKHSGNYPLLSAALKIFGGQIPSEGFLLNTHARAKITTSSNYCMLALGQITPYHAGYLSGSSIVHSKTCGLAVDSKDSCALWASGNTKVDMPISVSGGSCGNKTTSLNLSYARPVKDPMLDDTTLLQAMTTSYPQTSATRVNNNATSLPYSPNNHFSTLPSSSLHLAPGVYYFDDVAPASGQPIISGDGVTLIFKSTISFPTNLPTFNLRPPTNSNATSDPNSCPFCGISIASTSTSRFKLTGGELFSGSVYLPKSYVTYTGNTKETCLQIISDGVEFTGDATLTNDPATCPFIGGRQVKQTIVQLVQ